MGGGNELRRSQRPRADTQQGRDVEGFELRVNRDAILIPQQAIDTDRLAVAIALLIVLRTAWNTSVRLVGVMRRGADARSAALAG
ncbi:MAG: hypothetical protein U1A72_15470 [Sulfuritalea sp.]|nr:hypothetical protein [Sulfuritalea sp.]